MRTRRPNPNPIPILILAVVLAACGAHGDLQRHALAAQVVADVATGSRAAVLAALEDDVAAATAGVADQVEREQLAAKVRARYMAPGGAVDLANAINRIGLAYVRAVLVLEQEHRPAWSKVLPLLGDALAVYAELRRVVGGGRLPAVPAAVAGLVAP